MRFSRIEESMVWATVAIALVACGDTVHHASMYRTT